MTYKCSECNKVFTRKFNRDKHYNKQHSEEGSVYRHNFICPFCSENGIEKHFQTRELLVQHVDETHLDLLQYNVIKSAFNGKLSIFSKKFMTLQPLENFISNPENLKEILTVILHQLSKFQVIKVAIIMTADYRIPSVKQSDENEDNSGSLLAEERDNFSLRTKREIFSVNESKKSVVKKIRNLFKSLLDREQDLLMRGSGWQFESLHQCDIEIVSHNSI